MAAELTSIQFIIEYEGWDTIQQCQPVPFPEYVGIKLSIHYHDYVNDFMEPCVSHVGFIHAMREAMLDDNKALNSLSSYLSAMRIAVEDQPEIIADIVFWYRKTNSSVTRKSEKDLPVISFRLIYETRMSYNEADAATRAIEESMEANTCNPIPAAKFAIDALEKVKLDRSKSNETCVICLEKLRPGKQVTRMPCSHIFHGDCIVQWLQTSHLCPLCRFEMPIQVCQYCGL